MQTEKSGTLGTGNDQTIFCLQGNGIDRADTAGCNGKGWREDACYTLNTIDRPAVCAEVRCMTPWDAQSQRVYDGNGVSPTLSSRESSGLNREAVLCAGFKLGNSEQARSIGYQEELSPTLNAECGGNKPAVVAPAVALDTAHTLRAKANCANREDAETYICSAVDCRNGQESDVNGALQARTGHTLNANGVVRSNMVVRRLTPMECERLQGFPDHWTDIGEWTDEKGKKHKNADSPRYKALGNSIALPFWDWMLRRMARYLPEDATLGSLFDGIGGFPLCFERIHGKGTARWASEIERFPIAVTKKHFPEEE